jgi:hypothetical protein
LLEWQREALRELYDATVLYGNVGLLCLVGFSHSLEHMIISAREGIAAEVYRKIANKIKV